MKDTNGRATGLHTAVQKQMKLMWHGIIKGHVEVEKLLFGIVSQRAPLGQKKCGDRHTRRHARIVFWVIKDTGDWNGISLA